jgi:hypothetical protein
MHYSTLVTGFALVSAAMADLAGISSRRGLIYIDPATASNWPKAASEDYKIFLNQPTDITWYYNYKSSPSAVVAQYSPSTIFVPMLWGYPSAGSSDTTFLSTVKAAVAAGQKIDSVLFLNEPDGSSSTGGSQVTPAQAAALWKTNMEPIRSLTGTGIVNGTIKLGGPAVTGGPGGITWLQEFQTACDGGCSVDFIPVHFYGDFQGLASNIGEKQGYLGDWAKEIWITEYAFAEQSLSDTQNFFNQTASYFDRLNFTTRYSYFGSFRSSTSNVGPNVAMLNGYGNLTDIGAWYLGRQAMGVLPTVVGSGADAPSASSSLGMGLMAAVAVVMALF